MPADVPPADTPAQPDHPPLGTTASNTGRKFPCPGCGAKLDFNPNDRTLKCSYCGYAEQIEPAADGVPERDWDEYWKNSESGASTIEGRSREVKCRACAAVVLLEDKVVTDQCPYCGNDLENRPDAAESMILPAGILPFKVDLKRAGASFRQWVGERWFAPSDLRHLADLGRLNGIYVPFWTFDSMTYSRYSGQRGDNYQELETYVAHETFTEQDGRGNFVTQTRPVTKQRMVTRIRWTPAAGEVDHFFDDVLVCASRSIPPELLSGLGPWDSQNYEPFQPQFLAGFQTERYTIGLKPGFDAAQSIMDGTIRQLCCADIGGDQQQLHTVHTRHAAITFKHVLQPVWLAPYRYRDRLYRIAVNARTGEVVGTRPYSYWKIGLTIAIVLAILAIIGLFASSAHSATAAPTTTFKNCPRSYPQFHADPIEVSDASFSEVDPADLAADGGRRARG